MDKFNCLSPNRFDNIEKDPIVSSHVKRPFNIHFGSQLPRKTNLFDCPENPGTFYNAKKEQVMSRLDAGIAKMNRQSCKVLEKKIKKEEIMSCVDPQRVMDSTTRKLKPKAGMASLDLTK